MNTNYEDLIVSMPPGARMVAIGGVPMSGKTTLAEGFQQHGWEVVHTDDYLSRFPQQTRPAQLIELVKNLRVHAARVVVEGTEVGRMLRTGDRTGTWFPDWILWRQPEARLHGFAKGLQTIFADYLESRTVQVQMLFAP
jgi:chloramphenicol 3-O-phosphotransferase